MIALKAEKERESFKKVLSEYKDKIKLLTSIVAKSRITAKRQ